MIADNSGILMGMAGQRQSIEPADLTNRLTWGGCACDGANGGLTAVGLLLDTVHTHHLWSYWVRVVGRLEQRQ